MSYRPTKGTMTTPENPGGNRLMLWIRDHVSYQGDDCLIWPFSLASSGYGSYLRSKRKFYVHRYMCQAINGPPPTSKHHAAHSCGRGQQGCVNPRHLSWKTNSENQLDRRKHGTSNRTGTLSERDATEIRAMRGVEPGAKTAMRFGVSETTVRQIQTGKIWRPESRRYNYSSPKVSYR